MAYVNGSSHQNGSAAATTTCAVTYSPTNGNLLCVTVGFPASSVTVPTCSVADNASGGSNTYTAPAVNRTFVSGDNYSVTMRYVLSVSGAPTTITATISQTQQFITIIVDEYSNLTAFDTSNITTSLAQAGGTNAVKAGNITTTANGDLIYGVAIDSQGNGGATTTGTSPLSATARQTAAGVFYTEDATQTSLGLLTNGITFSSTSTSNWVAGVMAFKAAASSVFSTTYHWNLGVSV